MQPILRYSRSGAAWVREPTTWLPGRTYARRVGKMETDRRGLGMARMGPFSPSLTRRSFCQISTNPQSAGRPVLQVCRNPVGVTYPQPLNPVLISQGIVRLLAVLVGPTSTMRRSSHHQKKKKWHDCVSAPLPVTQGTPACFFRISCARRAGADFSKRPSFSDVINCMPRKTACDICKGDSSSKW